MTCTMILLNEYLLWIERWRVSAAGGLDDGATTGAVGGVSRLVVGGVAWHGMARRGLGLLWWRRCGLTRPGGAGREAEDGTGAADDDPVVRPRGELQDLPVEREDTPEKVADGVEDSENQCDENP